MKNSPEYIIILLMCIKNHNHFIYVYNKWQSYHVWFLRYWKRRTIFFAILDFFLLFYLPNKPKKKIEKIKKTPRDTIIYTCVP